MNSELNDTNMGAQRADAKAPAELRLKALTFEVRSRLQQILTDNIDIAGGWVLDRTVLSASTVEWTIELQARVLMDLYAALAGSDLILTRLSHQALTGRCNCLQHLHRRALAAVLTVRLEVAHLTDPLLTGALLEGCQRMNAA